MRINISTSAGIAIGAVFLIIVLSAGYMMMNRELTQVPVNGTHTAANPMVNGKRVIGFSPSMREPHTTVSASALDKNK